MITYPDYTYFDQKVKKIFKIFIGKKNPLMKEDFLLIIY
jgi:hypothetical protein